MRNLLLTTLATLFIAIGMNASTTNTYNNEQPFIFVESGIEFAVFKDGQFDFNVLNPSHKNVNVRLNTGIIDFSFNTGYNYDTYVQYDDYGAVIQIENTPIFYDYYGRVNRIGNIHMAYNNNLISRIGNMHLTYNRYGNFRYANGIINNYNINYRYGNRYKIYRRPIANRVIVHHTPYRRTFVPVRCDYVTYRRNYANNYNRTAYVNRNYRRPGKVYTKNYNRNYNNNRRVTTNRNYNNNRKVTANTKRATNNNVKKYNTTKRVVKNTNNSNYRTNTSKNYNNSVKNNKTRSYNNNTKRTVTTRNNTKTNKQYAVKSTKNYKSNKRTVAANSTRNNRR